MKIKKIVSLIESLNPSEMKQLLKEFIENKYGVEDNEENFLFEPYRECELIDEVDYEKIMRFVEEKRRKEDKRTYAIGQISIQTQSYNEDFESGGEYEDEFYEEYYESSSFYYKEFIVYYIADEDVFYVDFDDILMQDFENPDLIDLLKEVKKELDLYEDTSEKEGIKIENYGFKSFIE